MSLEANLADLRSHADDFTAGRGFTFTVLDPVDGSVVGCVYLYPPGSEGDVSVRSCVRADSRHPPARDVVDEYQLGRHGDTS